GRSFYRDKVRSLAERRYFVATLIVRQGAAKMKDAAHALKMVLTIHHDLRMADGVLEFIEHLAGEHGVRREADSKAFGIALGTGYDRGRETVMLVVGSGDEPAFRSLERVLARGDMELE